MFYRAISRITVLIILVACVNSSPAMAVGPNNLFANPTMAGVGSNGLIPAWKSYGEGYTRDTEVTHASAASVRFESNSLTHTLGAMQTIVLNQVQPAPVVVSAWSRALSAHGQGAGNYCLYADVNYNDGTHLWGQSVDFESGTHSWERRRETILPAKPVLSINVFLLFRNVKGTAWFSDVHATQLSGVRVWDGQSIAPPLSTQRPYTRALMRVGSRLSLGFSPHGALVRTTLNGRIINTSPGGFFIRDVKADGHVVPLAFAATVARDRSGDIIHVSGNSTSLGLLFASSIRNGSQSILVNSTVTNMRNCDRDITVYFALPVDATGWTWGDDIRTSRVIGKQGEFHTWSAVSVGACGSISRYPFAEVNNRAGGVALNLSPREPDTSRLFYNAEAHELVVAFDFAFARARSRSYACAAHFRFRITHLPAAPVRWGFREAAAAYYGLHPQQFPSATVRGGIWMPFTDPSTVADVGDFHIRYHEGDNSVFSDRKLGILSFHYTEPSSCWIPMPATMPRTYEAVMSLVHSQLLTGTTEQKRWAAAVINSGTRRNDGRLNVQFRNEPWCNGALFVLNPNPALATSSAVVTKSSLTYDATTADSRYISHAASAPSGEYLDSLEGWLNTETSSPKQLAACPYPLTFDSSSLLATVPQWYSLFGLVSFMSRDLHARHRQLMANTTPVNFWCFMPMLDEAGIEVNWLGTGDAYSPDSDEIFDYRRTLAYHKPYLLLMNTNFDRFNGQDMARYFRRCLFYDVFPSCFSADAADQPYWETPRWYNRDRALFKAYIPIMQQLSLAGWQPVTYALSSNPKVYVERYGTRWLTLRNASNEEQTATLKLWAAALQLKPDAQINDCITGWSCSLKNRSNRSPTFTVRLAPNQVMALHIRNG